jgi:hypothetical protein
MAQKSVIVFRFDITTLSKIIIYHIDLRDVLHKEKMNKKNNGLAVYEINLAIIELVNFNSV